MPTPPEAKNVPVVVYEPQLSLPEVRESLLPSVKPAAIHRMQKDKLIDLQAKLCLGAEWGIIDFPRHWMSPGVASQESFRKINIHKALRPLGLPTTDIDLIISSVVRLTLLCLMFPTYGPRYTIYLAATTTAGVAQKLTGLAKLAITLPENTPGRVFERIQPHHVAENKRFRIEMDRMLRLTERGFWNDVPALNLHESPPISPKGPQRPKPRQQEEVPYLPLNDKFVGEAGYRVAWFTETLGPTLLDCARGLRAVFHEYRVKRGLKKTPSWFQTDASIRFLSEYVWRGRDGLPIGEPPFDLNFKGMGGKGGDFKWPARTLSQLRMLLRVLQSCHLFVFLISTGGRISECLSLGQGCVTESPDGVPLANGRTYKLTYQVGGEERDWPLPELGVTALRQQQELAELIFEVDGRDEKAPGMKLESIWTREGGNGERIDGEYNNYLKHVVKAFGLTEEFGGGNMHAHRFRKTTARLIALSVLGAPKILMDLFGHRQIAMTLHYILSDPVIRAEMLEVARAQVIMLAKDVIQNVDKCGGPAAEGLKKAVKKERLRLASDFGESTLQGMAELLTLNGRHWQLVRPGVICTKAPQATGACTPNTAMPEQSRCRSHCTHRLEQEFLKKDVDEVLELAVKQLSDALAQEDEMGVEMWRGQILASIGRFAELKTKWAVHPLIAPLLNECETE